MKNPAQFCVQINSQKLRGQVGLRHADLRDGIGEGHRRRVDNRRAPGASRIRADVDNCGLSKRAACPEVQSLGHAGRICPRAHPIGCGRDSGADRGRRRGNRDPDEVFIWPSRVKW